MSGTVAPSLAAGFVRRAFLAVGVIACVAAALPAAATSINYGDFSGTSVMYLDVTETANTPGDEAPLFGGPEIIGNKLDFDPAGFNATATSGAGDFTDGQLNFVLMAAPQQVIDSIVLMESGDYSLIGNTSFPEMTRAVFGVSVSHISVLEIDGAPISPVMLETASSSGSRMMQPGPDADEILQPWDLSLFYDVDAALADAGIQFTSGATKLEIVLDNALGAISENGTIASISKKDFMLDVGTRPVPEPSTVVLLSIGLIGLARSGRQRRAARA